MTAKEFKVGDIVDIKPNVSAKGMILYGGLYITSYMYNFVKGKYVKINEIKDYGFHYELINEDGEKCSCFTDEMLMLVKGGKKKMGMFKKSSKKSSKESFKESFKVGDRVVKVKAYTSSQYCRFGGNDREVPIGTLGTIKSVNSLSEVRVKFDNNVDWNVDVSEISFAKGYKRVKAKPVELHVVLNDACDNFVEMTKSYEDAIKLLPNENIVYGVYKLMRVATLEHTVKVTKSSSKK
jgi:hypothetical protein